MKFSYICILLSLVCSIPKTSSAEEDGYIKAECVIHVHTTVSSGYLSVEDYSRLAKDKDVDVVILTDNALHRYEYGLWPLRKVLKKVREQNSILKFGPKNYLESIEKANVEFKDVIIIDGAQVTPFYFWTGSVFNGNLTLNNRNKDFLVIGLVDAKAYKDLPIIGNRRTRFDQYHGDKFNEPYQDLIDYVNRRGGLVFWSHPEVKENFSTMGVLLITAPYPYALLETRDYTGFGVFAEGYNVIGKPLGLWDRILTEYCLGKRTKPIWAIGELEYGGEEDKNLNDTINMLYVKKLDRENILSALKNGKFYVAYKDSRKIHLVLEEFSLGEGAGGRTAMMGETLVSEKAPLAKVKLSHEKFTNEPIAVKLIRNNQIIKEFTGAGSVDVEFYDEEIKPNDSVYYRIDAVSQDTTRLISNPIFFKRTKER